MNEKKAIVFFFFCFVVFFSFFFYFLVVVPSTYVTRIRLSLAVFVLFVSVCSSSPSSCARSPASVLLARPMCVCVRLSISTFCCCCFFRGPLTVFQTLLLPFLRALGFFFVFCFNVVIRGGVFLHFFFLNKTHTHVHTYTDTGTHTQTDGWRKVRARR